MVRWSRNLEILGNFPPCQCRSKQVKNFPIALVREQRLKIWKRVKETYSTVVVMLSMTASKRTRLTAVKKLTTGLVAALQSLSDHFKVVPDFLKIESKGKEDS